LAWRHFFTRVGVGYNISISILERYDIERAQRELGIYMNSYITLLKDERISPKKLDKRYYFQNFVHFRFLDYLHYPEIMTHFLTSLVDNWLLIRSRASSFRMISEAREIQTPFLTFVLQKRELVRGSKSKVTKKTTELFSSRLRGFRQILDVADLPVDLTDEQSEFLGFKTKLSSTDCLNALNELNKTKNTNPDNYSELFKQLLALDPKEARDLSTWTGHLLAEDNSLQPKTILQFWGTEIKLHRVNAKTILKHLPGLTHLQMIKACDYLGVSLVGRKEVVLIPTESEEDTEAKKEFLSYIPYLALMIAHHQSKDPMSVYSFLSSKTGQLTFLSCNRLRLSFSSWDNQVIYAYCKENFLYFHRRWRNHQTLRPLTLEIVRYLEIPFELTEQAYDLLCEETTELSDWLIDRGYYIENLPTEDVSDVSSTLTPEEKAEKIKREAKFSEALENVTMEMSEMKTSPSNETSFKSTSIQKKKLTTTIFGLQHQPVPGDGHCLFHAVGLHLGWEQKDLRTKVAKIIEQNMDQYKSILNALNPLKTPEEYLQDLRLGIEWADNLEIAVLMKMLDRPIVVIGPTGNIMNLSDLTGESDPIFVQYNGYNHYDALILTGEKTAKEIFEHCLNSNQIDNDVSETTKPLIIQDFVPEVSNYQINLEHLAVNSAVLAVGFGSTKKGKRGVFKPPKRTEVMISDDVKSKIGKAGEEIVFLKLRYDYIKKYGTCEQYNFSETELGFIIACVYKNEKIQLEVIWHNKNGEQGKSKDFTIIKNGIKRIIEVKSTPSATKDIIDISGEEVNKMHKYKERYRLFRVYQVGTKCPRIEKIKNPSDKLGKELAVKSYKIRL